MRSLLKHTWTIFFSRYATMTPIQKKAIPVILEKKNALLISPTASGKTEAVIVPLIERLINENWVGLSIIYISPTKALVNDLSFRLKELCKELNIDVAIKTGDSPSFNADKISGILITTPESFDSILCRYKASLFNLKALILDEIHLVDNTYRGDQLRVLIKRAEETATGKLNIYILSATVANPTELGKRYGRDMEVIEVPGRRTINHTFIRSLEELKSYTIKENLSKLLIFCNKRVSVELYANACKELWGEHQVVVHHGSLSARVRNEAENFMKENYFGICVSTMTLEIGIDIGNIDAVVLAEVPWSISAMLQRIGRSNRRSDTIRVFAIYSSDREKEMLELMMQTAKMGLLDEYEYTYDHAVLVQQIFSLLYAYPQGINDHFLIQFLSDFCEEAVIVTILEYLENLGWIQKHNNVWFAATILMNLGAIGKIHSNIPDTKTHKVINITTNTVVGEVTSQVDNIFILAGKIWKIVHKTENKIFVKPVKRQYFKAEFKTIRMKSQFYYLLPPCYQDEDYDFNDNLIK